MCPAPGDHVFQQRPGGLRRRWKVIGAIIRLRPLSRHSMRAIFISYPIEVQFTGGWLQLLQRPSVFGLELEQKIIGGNA